MLSGPSGAAYLGYIFEFSKRLTRWNATWLTLNLGYKTIFLRLKARLFGVSKMKLEAA
jgi:hypothetical protein